MPADKRSGISTRDRIITEATRLFAANGIKATTIAQIETAVGLREGSGGVHRHFPSKDELVAAVLEAQLASGAETVETSRALPLPAPDEAGAYLRQLGQLVLTEAAKNKEVALIMLRDARSLGDRLDIHRRRNDALAYGVTANAVRELQAKGLTSLSVDPDTYGYVLLAPLIYFKLIEWASGRTPLDIDDTTLVETWATAMEPTFRLLAEANAPSRSDTPVVAQSTSQPVTRGRRKPAKR
jgi:AcrR family transcriptional regulator